MTPEEILEWADKVREATAPEPYSQEWLDRFFDSIPKDTFHPSPPLTVPPLYVDCNCPLYGVCMRTACPRAMRITNNLNGIEV